MKLTRSQLITLIVLGVLTVVVYGVLVAAVVLNSRQISQMSAPAAATSSLPPAGAGEAMSSPTAIASLIPIPTITPTPSLAPQTRYDLQVVREPEDPTLRLQRGYAYIELDAYSYAVDDFNIAIGLDETLFDAYHGRGLAHFYLKEWNVALEDFDQALALNPDLAEAHAWRGYLLYLRGKYEPAIKALRQAVALDGVDPAKRVWLAEVLLRSGDAGEAEAEYATALSLDARSIAAYVGRALARAEQRNFQGATDDLDRAREISPHDPVVLSGRAWFYAWYQHDHLEEAEQLAQRALAGAEDDLERASCLDTLGWVYYEQGRYDEAAATLEEAVALATVEGQVAYPDMLERLKKARAAQ